LTQAVRSPVSSGMGNGSAAVTPWARLAVIELSDPVVVKVANTSAPGPRKRTTDAA